MSKSTPNTLPSGWRLLRFGDVVRNVDVAVRNPFDSGLERYVGLEHIDPEALHIRRWGQTKDGTTFTRKFVKGQVLFGKRRAYQRKVAVAEFDGVCSGDILVFEPKDDRLRADLLPFLVQSEGFFQHALGTSAGSLSPRTRWRDLEAYEFALPPLDEQRRIAEILWAADEAVNCFRDAAYEAALLKASTTSTFTSQGIVGSNLRRTSLGHVPDHWSVVTVGDVLSVCQYGLSMPMNESGQYPILRMGNIMDGRVMEADLKYVDLEDEDYDNYRLEKGDILFNRTNSADLVGKVGIYLLDGDHVFASYLVRLRSRPDLVLPEYLNYYLNSEAGQQRILSHATPGVSQWNINASNLRKVLLPLPPLQEQRVIVASIRNMEIQQEALVQHARNLASVQRELMSSMLEATWRPSDV